MYGMNDAYSPNEVLNLFKERLLQEAGSIILTGDSQNIPGIKRAIEILDKDFLSKSWG